MSNKKTEWMQNWRKNNPIKAAFQAHKDNAKRRGIPSSLTFEQFKEFAIGCDYIAQKGIRKHSMHIDRKRENEGYHVDNIQPLENTDNIKKSLEFRGRNQHGKTEFKVKTSRHSPAPGAPF